MKGHRLLTRLAVISGTVITVMVIVVGGIYLYGWTFSRDDGFDGRLADRVLRLSEELETIVDVQTGEIPSDLSELLNPDSTADTPKEDLVALVVHPDGKLLGSFRIQRPDGVINLWLFYDVPDDERSTARVVMRQLDETPWQVVGGQSTDARSAVRFENTQSADVVGTVFIRAIVNVEGGPITSVVYILEVQPLQLVSETEFELPAARPIPDDFPAAFLLVEGMTPITVLWLSEAAGDSYQVILLTRESAFDVAAEYRERLAEKNWELVDDRAIGFATVLDFQTEDGATQGSLTADAFADDNSYTSIVLDIRVSSRTPSN